MKWTFGIKGLFGLTCLCSCMVAVLIPDNSWLGSTIATVLLVNLIGFVVAIFLTHVVGFPTDGGYRDPEIQAPKQLEEFHDRQRS